MDHWIIDEKLKRTGGFIHPAIHPSSNPA